MARPKKPRPSPAEGELPFQYHFERPTEEVLTAYAGVPLLVRAARWLGVPDTVKRHLRLKQCQRGFEEAPYAASKPRNPIPSLRYGGITDGARFGSGGLRAGSVSIESRIPEVGGYPIPAGGGLGAVINGHG